MRRCAFKVPKNERYQCQKAGDKHQLNIDLWYCSFHDLHAQDRCQVLVQWAGMGAQCEQLGVLDEDSGVKLCELHRLKYEDETDALRDNNLKEFQDGAATVEERLEKVDSLVRDLHLYPIKLEHEEYTTAPSSRTEVFSAIKEHPIHTPFSNTPNTPKQPTHTLTTPTSHKRTSSFFFPLRTPFSSTLLPTPSPSRNAALYVQCCVCLEQHSEQTMSVVEPCGHRYRELCLRKVVTGGMRRKFNCRGCGAWMGGLVGK
jgi:hypothetical protein